MSSLNRVILLGNLGKDPEVRYTQGGTTVANLRIATNERRPDGQGGWKDETEWHSVVLFGKQADLAKQYLSKGRTVLIEGSLRTRQWQDKEGQTRYTTEIVADQMTMLGARPEGSGQPQGEYAATNTNSYGKTDNSPSPVGSNPPAYEEEPDDLPF